MKILYYDNPYGYHVEIAVYFCCERMSGIYDFSHRNSWCIALGHKSGKVRLYGAFDYQKNEYQHVDIDHCPFCGEKVEIEQRFPKWFKSVKETAAAVENLK